MSISLLSIIAFDQVKAYSIYYGSHIECWVSPTWEVSVYPMPGMRRTFQKSAEIFFNGPRRGWEQEHRRTHFPFFMRECGNSKNETCCSENSSNQENSFIGDISKSQFFGHLIKCLSSHQRQRRMGMTMTIMRMEVACISQFYESFINRRKPNWCAMNIKMTKTRIATKTISETGSKATILTICMMMVSEILWMLSVRLIMRMILMT